MEQLRAQMDVVDEMHVSRGYVKVSFGMIHDGVCRVTVHNCAGNMVEQHIMPMPLGNSVTIAVPHTHWEDA
jgi:hypothetical protein